MFTKQEVTVEFTNVLVVGVFDLFHRGHLELLNRAGALGQNVYVVVNGDELTKSYKRSPLHSEDDRLAIVSSLKIVTDAVISNSFDVKPFIEKFKIDAIVHGDDWPHDAYLTQICCTEQYLIERGVQMVYTPYYGGVSTSSLIENMKCANAF